MGTRNFIKKLKSYSMRRDNFSHFFNLISVYTPITMSLCQKIS